MLACQRHRWPTHRLHRPNTPPLTSTAPVESARIQLRILTLHELANIAVGLVRRASTSRGRHRHCRSHLPPSRHAPLSSKGTTESERVQLLLLLPNQPSRRATPPLLSLAAAVTNHVGCCCHVEFGSMRLRP
ncbi:hypothetical protein AXF42_Ash017411 [Apostasia shenzhenica]|uniref:Uncharacterized protein n=1 Tax=Apostasia shenzhenica TaxID=1088818 RepID=A0A2H9ZZ12_9ASPA|nr:hypothetical protein AXF42_Ash017411 [Apostasia shenzhenica]